MSTGNLLTLWKQKQLNIYVQRLGIFCQLKTSVACQTLNEIPGAI